MTTRDQDLQAKFYIGIMVLLMATAIQFWVNGGVKEALCGLPLW